jgi:hypothetical protein
MLRPNKLYSWGDNLKKHRKWEFLRFGTKIDNKNIVYPLWDGF